MSFFESFEHFEHSEDFKSPQITPLRHKRYSKCEKSGRGKGALDITTKEVGDQL